MEVFEGREYRYVIGVDLGTTNSAVAYVDLGDASAPGAIRFFQVPQLVAAGETAPRPVLPSFLYLPGAYDLPEGSTALPWDAGREYVVGTFAREQGARVPGRLVASAKSWLSHGGVDRTAPILPWGAGDEVPKVSPVTASRRYLQHLREAWNAEMAGGRETHRFEAQLVVLTVPASFDEVARELTVQAAREAGLPRVVLLEEPLAAFYAWLSDHEASWHEHMADGQLILVCDVGGGTTDFSIVGIREGEKGLRFNRLAVGEHLLLGGDNMDLTLGRYVEQQLLGRAGALDPGRWHQLVYQCRQAKETLLGTPDEDAEATVTVTGTGSRLIGGTLSTRLSRETVRSLLLDGFFPASGLDAHPEGRRRGLTELGLPYVQDPAITHHLAAFWQRFAGYLKDETGREAPFPDFILFNGGALAPALVRDRLRGIVGEWFAPAAGAAWSPEELANPRPDLAVAVGAAYYGRVRLGEGVRVGSGSPRAYYVGVDLPTDGETTYPAVCVVPRGTEEGFGTDLDEPSFVARTNQPVAFRLYTSSTRLGDDLGDVVHLPPEEVTLLPPIRTALRYGKKGTAQQLPVRLAVRLTEIGTLELWCRSEQTEHRWQLQFDVRQTPEERAQASVVETLDEAQIEAAQEAVRLTYEGDAGDHPPEPLRKTLEEHLERSKDDWPALAIRRLADAFLDVADGRTRSPEHEMRWFNLFGFCLRPGYGDPVDEWRMKQVRKLYFEELAFPRAPRCRSEWWVFWRRVAGGLSAGQQTELYNQVRVYLQDGKLRGRKPSRMYPKRLGAREELEIWMMLANFERLGSAQKRELGRLLLDQLESRTPQSEELWALSRLGARAPMYGPLDRVVAPGEVESWIDRLLRRNPDLTDGAAHALVQLARLTGDRARDVSDAARDRVADWLSGLPNAAHYRELLTDPDSARRREEQAWAFGESLPTGLQLSTSG